MKNMIVLATSLGLAAVGCSADADIGIVIDPVTCQPNAVAEVTGSVTRGTYHHEFGAATVTVSPPGTLSTVQLADGELILRLGFYCGPAQVATYGVIPDDQSRQLDCPLELAGAVVGQIEYMPARDGTVIIDQAATCLAGRFHVDLASDATPDVVAGTGELTGWFSAPLQ